MKRDNLRRLLRPRHIVHIGGRASAAGIAGTLAGGFKGPVWSVHPSHETLGGLKCFRRLADLPEAPDASFIWAPREITIELVGELAAMGAGGAVCYAAGFAEVDGAGAALQEELSRAAGDFAAMGPNCYGFVNFVDGAGVWPSGFAPIAPERGPALIAQSGNVTINMMYNQRSVPFSYVISTGNEAAVDSSDIINVLLDDDRVTAIGLYIEAIRDVAAFSRAGLRAVAAGVPLVALKAGKSEGARRAAMTHTGSLSGTDDAYEALFERLAISRAHSPEELMEHLKALSITGPLAGNRFAVMTCSGGEAALVSDYAEAQGIALPQPNEAQRKALREVLPDFAAITNPLDYNTSIWGQREPLERAFTAIMGAQCDAAILVMDFLSGSNYGDQPDQAIHALIAAAKATGVPAMHACSLSESVTRDAQKTMMAAGITPLQGLEQAIAAAGACVRYGARMAAMAGTDATLPDPGPAPQNAVLLDEGESKRRLAAYGLAVPESRRVAARDAAAAAAEIGYPVVLKAPGIAHKSEADALRLGLGDGGAVAIAAREMSDDLGVDDFLVEAMVDDGVCEMIVGVNRDPVLGLVLVVGSGGLLVEILDDSFHLLLPTDRASVARGLAGLKAAALLAGYRGRPAGDVDAAIDAILAVARFACDHRASLAELDVNPLILRPRGAVAVDALIRISED